MTTGDLSWGVPFRVDITDAAAEASDILIELGALDIEGTGQGGIAALMPDGVAPERIRRVLGVDIAVSFPRGRDADSVWVLRAGPVHIGRVRIVPADRDDASGAVRLADSVAFGTGLHPTTVLCLEALQDLIAHDTPDAVLDVGTGSGVLALAALRLGVPRAVALDLDAEAVRAAAGNVRLNGFDDRCQVVHGGPDHVADAWPLVLANVLAAPLIEMAPVLVRRVGHGGHLVLSGIPSSVEPDVTRVYSRLGLHHVQTTTRQGWTALVLRAPW